MDHLPRSFRWSAALLTWLAAYVVWAGTAGYITADEAALSDRVRQLRLVPFPKQIELIQGTFDLDRPLVLQVPAAAVELIGGQLSTEMKRAGLPAPKTVPIESPETPWLRLAAEPGNAPAATSIRKQSTDEDYAMKVRPGEITIQSPGDAGLLYGVQTLVQLIRANLRGSALPCLVVRDWPSLRWRCFQDDLTRGPSSRLETLKHQVDLGALLKMNIMTYYMEYQYAFEKHPKIGPPNGSLTPEELVAWVAYARPRHMEILGNQQSFGHFGHILAIEEYAHLRETAGVLSPVKEGTYELLDDMYSEVCPLLPFEMFNVCCDETWGLGTGPSKPLAEQIGVGGVYVRHIRRVHDILKDKYNKRMMMWGDIILKHPDKLDQIPKDTVMLTWGYSERDSFEDQIIPFADSGYEFFVCPGVSNWSRILPDFGVATTNIRNFVRDGAKHGALGMLNTAWEDDGEALNAPRWHGDAWGAECAWNASATPLEDFDRRVGAVLFGEAGDRFGQAIALLAQTHRLPGMQGMNNKRFWQNDFKPARSAEATADSAERLLELVRPAIEHLEACREEATVNAEMLDYFIFGARRMELIGTRMLAGLEAARAYEMAFTSPQQQALPLLAKTEKLIRENRDAHETLGREFRRLWLAESEPYALDWTLDRYEQLRQWHDALLEKLAAARTQLKAGRRLPPPVEIGLMLPHQFTRRGRVYGVEAEPLRPESEWLVPSATERLGLTVDARRVDRYDLPVKALFGLLPEQLADRPIRAFWLNAASGPRQVPVQLDPVAEKRGICELRLILLGKLPKESKALVHVYWGVSDKPPALPEAVTVSDGADGTKWIENDRVRLLLGPEGGHVYRWEVKALEGRDLTQPGTGGWAGFSDVAHGHRDTTHELTCLAAGPACVAYRCEDSTGLKKTISLWAGTSWMEVVFAEPVTHYWDFDNPKNFAADGPTPGEYLFSTGRSGPVGKQSEGVPAQVKATARWAVKFNPQKLALGMVAPETDAAFVIAPGAGAGGVGIERSSPVGHFVTFGGLLETSPGETMQRLRDTLDFTHQPYVVLHAMQSKGR